MFQIYFINFSFINSLLISTCFIQNEKSLEENISHDGNILSESRLLNTYQFSLFFSKISINYYNYKAYTLRARCLNINFFIMTL